MSLPQNYTLGRREARHEPRNPDHRDAELRWVGPGGHWIIESVKFRNTSGDGIGVWSPIQVQVGSTVWVRSADEPEPEQEGSPAETLQKAVVRHCRKSVSGFVMGLLRIHQERRRVDREPVHGQGTLEWADRASKTTTAEVKVLNATDIGLQVESPVGVPVPVVVRIAGEGIARYGSTCYCKVLETGGHLVGIHFVR